MTAPADRLAAALADRYRIERELGAGGMATVYLAHDIKHDRDVAIKVLHPDLGAALGSERFLTEIRTTARLQHPHILPLLDSGAVHLSHPERSGLEDRGVEGPQAILYYVMPLVTGETLRSRLERERQLPVEDAVLIAREVADALGYAHGLGVIHRDIKPENILLQGGHALVADFGIALAVQSSGGARMTQTGLSLGTPQYMSPEQAMGEKQIDARSDIYALGAVTYEMLVGEAPFTGPSVQAIVARIMTEQPRAISIQRKAVPEQVEFAVLHALEKLPADRFATAMQFAEALAGHGPTSAMRTTATNNLRVAAGGTWRHRFQVAAAVAVLAAGLATWSLLRPRTDARQVTRQYITFGDSANLEIGQQAGPPLALSPDGSRLAYVGDTLSRLWIKRRDALEATPIAGTDGAGSPVFSPDGKWLGYVAGGQVRKVPVDGGVSITLDDSAGTGYGLAWLDDGTLIYTGASLLGLRRVSESGANAGVVLADSALHGNAALWPTALPGSRGVVYAVCASNCVVQSLHVLDLKTGREKLLVADGTMGWYLPTGQLLYVRRDGVALVAPFDLPTLTLQGAAQPILQGVAQTANRPLLAWSPSGGLVYAVGGGTTLRATLQFADSRGVTTAPDSSWSGNFNSFALSPDGRRVAVGVTTGNTGLDIWIKQLDRGPFTRLTFSGRDRRPAWSPDGRQVAFVRDSGSGGDIYARAADGGGSERRMAHLDRALQEVVWSRDGRWLLVRTDNGAAGNGDIYAVRTEGDTTPLPLAITQFTEIQPTLSPDGHWMAYVSNETGINEVYVRPFPAAEAGKWQVSNGGGNSPVWSPNGQGIFFLNEAFRMMASAVSTTPTFHVTGVTPLFEARRTNYIGYHQSFDVTHDGHFAYFDAMAAYVANRPRLVQVDNWFADLRARQQP
ncbi:MAG: protein kinase [Gemmatimonadales bacterium]